MDRMGENSRGKANLKRCVLSFERNVERDNNLRVSGGRYPPFSPTDEL